MESIKFRKAVVFYCDILGFEEILKNRSSIEFLLDFKSILEKSLEHIKAFHKVSKDRINFKIFSDNLYFSISYDEKNQIDFGFALMITIYIARIYQVLMLESKYLIRGGIAIGDDYSDDDVIFSLPLLQAYELESKKAVYPRILLHESIIVKIKKNGVKVPSEFPELLTLNSKSLIVDYRGDCFINPEFSHINQTDRAKIGMESILKIVAQVFLEEKSKKSESDLKVFEKQFWLKTLLEWVLNPASNNPHEFSFVFESN